MPTPLYDALRGYADKKPLRFHMPGHKGKFLPVPELAGLAALDLTELSPTGNLYEAGEPFDSARRLWAELFGFDCCQFLTGGSTVGIHTGKTLSEVAMIAPGALDWYLKKYSGNDFKLRAAAQILKDHAMAQAG